MSPGKKKSRTGPGDGDKRFQRLVENLNGMVYRCRNDKDWTMEYISSYAKKITGYSPEDLIDNRKKPYGELVHPDDRERIWDEIQAALDNQEPFVLNFRLITASGEEKWVWEQGCGVYDDDGHLLALEGFVTDITERMHLMQEVQQKEQLHRLVAEISIDVIWRLDSNLRFTYASPAVEKIFGYTPDEFVGMALEQTCPAGQYAKMTELIRTNIQENILGAGVLFETELYHKDGHLVPAEIAAKGRLDEDGNLLEIMGNTRDITRRIERRHELARTKELLENTFSSLADAVLIIESPGGIIAECNPAVESIFGYSEEELIGRNAELLFSDIDEYNRASEQGKERLKKNKVYHSSATMLRKNGKTIYTNSTTTSVRGDKGDLNYVVVVIRDVTEARKSEQQREELQEQLYQSQKMEAVGRLAGGIAHDFNNLLSVIMGYTSIMLMETQPGDKFHEFIAEINDAGVKASSLTRQLLAFGRKQTLETKVIYVNRLITDFQKLLRRVIGEDIELNLELCPEKVPVRADPSQMEQVLMNLAVNARDAMPDGGTITISTERMEPEEINYARIVFSDTGVGMDENTANRIFEPFFTTKGRDKGTGLGLATSFGIVKQHGGDISVTSEPGHGTSFAILLPLAPEEEVEDNGAGSAPLADENAGGSVMIVEDDRSVLDMARKILSDQGYTVKAFSRVDEALETARKLKRPLDLLLTDVVMPGMKGPELYENLKELHPETRVLYMSGYTDEAFGADGGRPADGHFIQKPFQVTDLLRKVAEVLRG